MWGTKGKKDIALKNRIWQAIAQKISPSSPCILRDWGAVRKKWQEFQSWGTRGSQKTQRAMRRRSHLGGIVNWDQCANHDTNHPGNPSHGMKSTVDLADLVPCGGHSDVYPGMVQEDRCHGCHTP